jgi:hypothetical protein
MTDKTIEEIMANSRKSSYDKAAWILLAMLIGVLVVIWKCPSIASHFAGDQATPDRIENTVLLGALVAELTIFLSSFIVLSQKPCFKYKSTLAVALLTILGCLGLGAITLANMAQSHIHNF